MKQILPILFILFLLGCSTPQIELQEVTNKSIVEDIPQTIEQEEPEIDTFPYYNFSEGETKEILDHKISLIKMYTNSIVDITVDGKENTLQETKNEEIIDNLRIQIYLIHDEYLQEKYATFKIEELILNDNEYILRKGEKITLDEKEIILEESKTNGYIQISVYNKGTVIGETQNIKRGESVEINGITITNLKNYYKVEQYAWLIIE